MCRVVKRRAAFLERLVSRVMGAAEHFRASLAHEFVAAASAAAAAAAAAGGVDASAPGGAAGAPSRHGTPVVVRRHVPVARAAPAGGDDRLSAAAADPRFAAFVAAAIAYLPYTHEEEPLCVIFNVNHAVALCGGCASARSPGVSCALTPGLARGCRDVKQALDAILAALEAAAEDEDDDVPVVDRRGRRGGGGGRGGEGEPLELDDRTARALVAAHGIMAALAAKHFLKRAYDLKDAKCLTYNPHSIAKAAERPLSARAPPGFAVPAPLDPTRATRRSLREYVDRFGRMLEDDPLDTIAHVAAPARKPRVSKAGAAGGGGDDAGGGGGAPAKKRGRPPGSGAKSGSGRKAPAKKRRGPRFAAPRDSDVEGDDEENPNDSDFA